MLWNRVKTFMLMAFLSALLIGLGKIVGGFYGMYFMLFIALLLNLATYWYSDKFILSLYHARPLNDPKVLKIVREVSGRMKLPMPKVYLIPLEIPNAFATGRSPKHSAVCLTSGIIKLLNERELRGVIAHEMAHIKNRDTLISVIASVIATAISYIAYLMRWFAFTDEDNPLELFLISIIAPFLALLIQLSISRTREFLADETGARAIKDPLGLASALEKLERFPKIPHKGLGTTENLFIVNPFKSDFLLNLLSTHPSTKERIRRLKILAKKL